MRHEKIITREDKSRIKIVVYFSADFRETYSSIYSQYCAPGKRTFLKPNETQKATQEETAIVKAELIKIISDEINFL